ncbi:hypothetical protein GGP91_002115 [Salinibacter ruber]|uniref:hypothetical protein n=1 Tax=Salinibacter ruber TaxID=146919 RepID=UPI0021694A51|nr:hypothetical protein [Salinibacter ruber]MCS3830029.1 hypothetical protein [Salinibacter ruber]
MSDLIFHIGLPKTASSFLQRNVFGGKMYTLEEGGNIDWQEQKRFHSFFRNTSPCVWRSDKAKKYLNSFHRDRKNVLISNESLYEGHLSVFPWGKLGRNRHDAVEPYLIADRIREISSNAWNEGDVKVFFFFRRQPDFIASFYSHVCHMVESPSQNDFEYRIEKVLDSPYEYGAPALCYNLLVEELNNAVGNQNVLAIPYEAFSADKTWKKVRAFTGIGCLGKGVDFENKSVNRKRKNKAEWVASSSGKSTISGYLAEIVKNNIGSIYDNAILIRRIGRKIKNLEMYGSTELKIEMNKDIRTKIMSLYSKSNKRLDKKIEYDLAKYDYY